MTNVDIEALVASNLKGWAEARLQKLADNQLVELAVAMGAAERGKHSLPEGKLSLIKAILQRKKELGKERAPSPLTREVAKEQEEAALLLQAKVKSKYRGVFVSRHQLKIMSFNSLKLRTGRAGLQEQWIAFAAMMGEFDIVLMSEVPAKQAKERSQMLIQLIQSCFASEDDTPAPTWSLHVSEPSGPGNPEVHVAFVRSPLKVIETQTLAEVDGVGMDHAPFQLLVEDPRFELSKKLVITHVHMPPKNRATDRDTQLKKLLHAYPLMANVRSHMPFDTKAAKERNMDEVTHVLCGDFNVYPDPNNYQLASKGWADPLMPERVSTSSGGKAYDNFIIDRHAASRCSTFSDVMELAIAQNSSTGEIGLSDHDPIVLTLKELPLTGRRTAREVSAV
jgi:endonuclease/exonuclease/phosphatase family metal-dependent hydrolase